MESRVAVVVLYVGSGLMDVRRVGVTFFFFKQKTAYEMLRSLVGSEMCIRDSDREAYRAGPGRQGGRWSWQIVSCNGVSS